MNRLFTLPTPHGALHPKLEIPATGASALVLIARPRHIPVDSSVLALLAARGYALLSAELLSAQEERFADAAQNVARLSQRLVELLDQVRHDPELGELPLALHASGDATPAALRAAVQRDWQVRTLTCHNGLLDRAGSQSLEQLAAPLMALFDAGESAAWQAYQRIEPRLSAIHEGHLLAEGETPVQRVLAWYGLHL